LGLVVCCRVRIRCLCYQANPEGPVCATGMSGLFNIKLTTRTAASLAWLFSTTMAIFLFMWRNLLFVSCTGEEGKSVCFCLTSSCSVGKGFVWYLTEARKQTSCQFILAGYMRILCSFSICFSPCRNHIWPWYQQGPILIHERPTVC
jgi:hypothetical protein